MKVSEAYSFCPNCLASLNSEQSVSMGGGNLATFVGLGFFSELLLSGAIALIIEYLWLIPQGIVTAETRDPAFWILALAIQSLAFVTHTLITGKEPKIGETKYTLSRIARFTLLGILFVFLGFILGGPFGVLFGVGAAMCTSIAIEHFFKRNVNPKRNGHTRSRSHWY